MNAWPFFNGQMLTHLVIKTLLYMIRLLSVFVIFNYFATSLILNSLPNLL